MKTKVNTDLIKEEIFKRYSKFIKPDNERKTMTTISLFCNELGVCEKTAYNILIGKMSLPMLYKVIDLLGIPEDKALIKQ